jgi:hypothetical protein
MGLTDRNGFCVPTNMAQSDWAECLVMKSSEIDTEQTFEELVEAIACRQL